MSKIKTTIRKRPIVCDDWLEGQCPFCGAYFEVGVTDHWDARIYQGCEHLARAFCHTVVFIDEMPEERELVIVFEKEERR